VAQLALHSIQQQGMVKRYGVSNE